MDRGQFWGWVLWRKPLSISFTADDNHQYFDGPAKSTQTIIAEYDTLVLRAHGRSVGETRTYLLRLKSDYDQMSWSSAFVGITHHTKRATCRDFTQPAVEKEGFFLLSFVLHYFPLWQGVSQEGRIKQRWPLPDLRQLLPVHPSKRLFERKEKKSVGWTATGVTTSENDNRSKKADGLSK